MPSRKKQINNKNKLSKKNVEIKEKILYKHKPEKKKQAKVPDSGKMIENYHHI